MAGKDVIVPIHMQHRHADPDGNRRDEAVNQCTDGLTGKTALTIKHGSIVIVRRFGMDILRFSQQVAELLSVHITTSAGKYFHVDCVTHGQIVANEPVPNRTAGG